MNQLLYRRAVRGGKKRLDELFGVRMIRDKLAQKQLSRQEIATAINLMSCILYLDVLIFPNDPIGHFHFSTTKLNDSMASYCHPSSGKCSLETYGVRVKELPQDLRKSLVRIVMYGKDGSETEECYDNLPIISYHQQLLSIAAHEVRHRLQKKGINNFSPDNRYSDEQINSYIWFLKRLFDENKDYGEIKDSALKADEFDARMVEKLVLYGLHYGAKELELCNLIKIEGQIAEE